ncbi:hypothetical protein [Streptomyces sp. NPDC001404]|uniref:hypothetical protein n=1 Tax=Streptomyces sp. NPDC001404 TaxID=3364571 RepID=UPI0036A19F9A
MASVEYCWLVTLQWTGADGATRTSTGTGLITPGTEATRENLTKDIINHARKQLGITDGAAAVMFLSLEPNEVKEPKKSKKNP